MESFLRNPDHRRHMQVHPNPTLFRIGPDFRYFQVRIAEGVQRYYLVSAGADISLLKLIALAKDGAAVSDLKKAFLADAEEREVDSYLDRAIEGQLLVPDLALEVTGDGPLEKLIENLETLHFDRRGYTALNTTKRELRQLDASGLGVPAPVYQRIADGLASFEPPSCDRLFQVDLTKPSDLLTLDTRIPEQLIEGARVLHSLFARPASGLATFCRRFADRYGNASVPLLEALDEESGIGFNGGLGRDAPLVRMLPAPARQNGEALTLDATSLLLQQLVYKALAAGSSEIVLDKESVDGCRDASAPPLPDAFHIRAAMLPPDETERPRTRLYHVSGPSGAKLFGRFCYADPRLMRGVQEHLTAEEQLDDGAYCELVHLPQRRHGNVIVRPALRRYEVPILAKSGAPAHQQVQLGDILVSVSDGHVALYAPKLKKRIIPRLTSAHNTGLPGLGVYKFLGEVQKQGVAAYLTWDWRHLQYLPDLPRVIYGRNVLTVRRWRLEGLELHSLSADSAAERFQRTQDLRGRRGLPRYVGLVDGDQVLPVDLQNIASVESALAIFRRRRSVTLCELCPGPDELVVEGPEGKFANEIIIPYIRTGTRPPDRTRAGADGDRFRRTVIAQETREEEVAWRRPPGSEWLYVKVYCGESTAEHLLLNYVRPFVVRSKRLGLIDRWFFVRYRDEHPHLRVRFRAPGDRHSPKMLSDACRLLGRTLATGLAWRVGFDTYEREIERYGGAAGLELCEALFHADSEAALALIQGADADGEERWLRTVAGVGGLLTDFGLTVPEMSELMASQAEALRKSVGIEDQHLHRVKEQYRRVRGKVPQQFFRLRR